MFNKDNNKKVKKYQILNQVYYKQNNHTLLTPNFVIMLNKYYESKYMDEHIDYDVNIKSYINKKWENNIKKEYNNNFINLYHHGSIFINKTKFSLKDFYIVFKDDKNAFHLICTNSQYHNIKCEYNKAVKLIDTTAFIKIIENNEIKDNTIIIHDINELERIVMNWDGFIHNMTSETDAIKNKMMIGNEKNE